MQPGSAGPGAQKALVLALEVPATPKSLGIGFISSGKSYPLGRLVVATVLVQ